MNKTCLLTALLCLLLTSLGVGAQQLPAFPGAEGYGKYVTGGRGGEVCYVTRTDDCSDNDLVEGTLRWALRHNNGGRPRTVLFAVPGTIYLTSKLKMQYGDVSILGQTAPGGGVTITGYPLYICRNNVILRHLRFRAGDIPDESLTGLDMENCDQVIIDHCSMTWSMEECLTAYDTDYTTIQWCIIGEGLYNSKNSKGARAYATQWGGEHSTMHHTLITNSHSRSPRFNGVRNKSNNPGDHDQYVESEFANNVVYNWSSYGSIYGGEYNPDCKGYNRVYMVNNYYRPGPSTQQGTRNNRYFTRPSTPYGEWYLQGNKFETSSKWAPETNVWSDTELAKVNEDNYYGTSTANASRGIDLTGTNATTYLLHQLPAEGLSGLQYESADDAFKSVTTQAGASLPRYDEVDKRLLDEAAGTTEPRFTGSLNEAGIIDSPDNIVLSYHDTYVVDGVTYTNMPRMFVEGQDRYAIDSDADGMPDAYEDEVGLDKNDPADGAAVAANGYTNLENYLNGVADGTINKTKYETSKDYVQPGPEEVAPETVTALFTCTDKDAEGQAPAAITVAYGETITIPQNRTLYKAGHTLTQWVCEGRVYEPGQTIQLTKETNTLTPVFTANKVDIADRVADVAVTWDFTADAPDFSATGIAVTQSTFSGAAHDVRLAYAAQTLTLPTCTGATVTLETTSGTEEYTATADTYTLSVEGKTVRSITISLPYVWNTPDRVYHEPVITAGSDHELFYTTPENAAAADWISGSYWEYPNDRTFFDPVKDDGASYILAPAIVVNASDQTLDIFVTATEKVRVFISSQSSNADRAVLMATPSDGSAATSVESGYLTQKQQPYVLELSLDKDKKYRLQVSTVSDYQISVGAIKLYGEQPVITEGTGTITWGWTGTATEKGLCEPSTVFASATAQLDETAFKVASKSKFNETFVTLVPNCGEQHEKRDATDVITFNVEPAPGVFFLPQHVGFHALRFGTDSENLDVTVQQGDAAEVTVLEGLNPNRDNGTTFSDVAIDLSKFDAITSSTEPLKVRIYVYNVFAGKEFGINNIVISGTFNGTPPEVEKYTFHASADPAAAAKVSWVPAGSEFEAGTDIELIADATTGYLFENWTDQTGEVVSTKEHFTYTITANTQLTAHYKSYDDYGYIFDCAPYDAAVKTINELKVALAKAAQRTDKTQRYRIFLHNGTYDYGSSVKNAIPGNVSLVGESQDGVLITNMPEVTSTTNRAETTPTFFIDQNENDVYLQDLTVRQGKDWASQQSTGQALAIRQRGKRAVYKNVTLQGIQDTYYLNKADATAYFETSTLAGQTDYIYGDGAAWFEQCNLYNTGAGYIVAPNTQVGAANWGFVLNACTVDGAAAAAGKFCLGRPWGDSPHATFLNTTFLQQPTEAGWGAMTAGCVLRFHEYGSMDATGAKLDLSKRSTAACSPATTSDAPVLTAEEAARYTMTNVFGTDWNPQALTAQLTAPAVEVSGSELKWAAVSGALGYAIVKDGSVVAFTTATSFDTATTGAGQYAVRVANECGGLGAPSSVVTGIQGVTADRHGATARQYDLGGRRVNSGYKGLVIEKGKKTVRK